MRKQNFKAMNTERILFLYANKTKKLRNMVQMYSQGQLPVEKQLYLCLPLPQRDPDHLLFQSEQVMNIQLGKQSSHISSFLREMTTLLEDN